MEAFIREAFEVIGILIHAGIFYGCLYAVGYRLVSKKRLNTKQLVSEIKVDGEQLKSMMESAMESALNDPSMIIELIEKHYGSGKAQAVSDLLNKEDE